MGIFGNNYAKEGPGVEKDAVQKKGLFLYFEIFIRKFAKLVQVNALHFFFSLIFIVIMYAIAPITANMVNDLISISTPAGTVLSEADVLGLTSSIQMGLRSLFAMIMFSLWGFGPITPAYAYITRCFAREQHAWIWSDFKDKVKENWKQGLAVFGIDMLVFFLGMNALMFYYSAFLGTKENMWFFILCITGVILLIYTMMHYYLYQIMITFECKLKDLYKNSIILALAKLPMSILLTAISVSLMLLIFLYLNPAISIILSVIIWVSIVRFPMEFYAARVIKKQIIDNTSSMIEKYDDREDELEG